MAKETHAITLTVTEDKLASTVGSGILKVYATPMMVAAMEQVASELLARSLETGQTSVGTMINISHIAATPLSMKVTAKATIVSRKGRTVEFEVSAYDECGEIGRGTHTRVIVDADRFQLKADSKRES